MIGIFMLLGSVAYYAYKVLPNMIAAHNNFYETTKIQNLLNNDKLIWDKAFAEPFRELVSAQKVLDLHEKNKMSTYENSTLSVIAGSTAMVVGGMFTAALIYKIGALAIIFGSAVMIYNFCYHLNEKNFAHIAEARTSVVKAYADVMNLVEPPPAYK